MPPSRKPLEQRFVELRQQLQNVGYFCTGTVLARRMKCGQPSCACHTEPAKRHGPYWEWTYKAQGRTVNVRLSPASGPLYQAAARQYQQLKALLRRLESLSRRALAAAARQAESELQRRRRSRSSPS